MDSNSSGGLSDSRCFPDACSGQPWSLTAGRPYSGWPAPPQPAQSTSKALPELWLAGQSTQYITSSGHTPQAIIIRVTMDVENW